MNVFALTTPLGLSVNDNNTFNNDSKTGYDSSFVISSTSILQNVVSRVESTIGQTNEGIDLQVATSVTQAVQNIITVKIAVIQLNNHFITFVEK